MEIVDTTVFSNFALIKRLDVLINTIELSTTEEVVEELKICVDKGIFELDFNNIKIISLNHQERLTFFRLIGKFGSGEASCLAIGMHKKAKIFTDDYDARKVAQRIGISVSGTLGILVKAVEKEVISNDEGNKLLHEMIENGFFSPFETLDKLLL